jgi:hypothetical protein
MGKKPTEEKVDVTIENEVTPAVVENGLKEIIQTPGHSTRAFRT